jgi:CHAD domain-containing protein
VREKASVKEIHRFRIAAKNLRYTLDLFAPLYGTSLAGLLDQLKDVQALLGDINDCATVRRMLSRQALPHPGGKEILSALKKRQRKKTEQFRQHYAAGFSSAATLRQWKDSLRGASGA